MVSESACQPTMGSRSTRAPPSGRRLALALGTVVLAVILAVATAVPIFGTFGGASASRAPADAPVAALPSARFQTAVSAGPGHGWWNCYWVWGNGGCSPGVSWEITSSGISVSTWCDSACYSPTWASSSAVVHMADTYGGLVNTVASHYGAPAINIYATSGAESQFGSDSADVMQALPVYLHDSYRGVTYSCGDGAGAQNPDYWAFQYADTHWSACSTTWLVFLSLAAGTADLASINNNCSAYNACVCSQAPSSGCTPWVSPNWDPEVLGPAYNHGSEVEAYDYAVGNGCTGGYDAWQMLQCNGYDYHLASAYNVALKSLVPPLTATYSAYLWHWDGSQWTYVSQEYCGDTIYGWQVGNDMLELYGQPSGGSGSYSYSWNFGHPGWYWTGSSWEYLGSSTWVSGGQAGYFSYDSNYGNTWVGPELKVSDTAGQSTTTGCSFYLSG